MRLLVIEDDQRIANLLRQGLEEEGYQVVVASDGRSGLDLGRTEQFDMIILDLMLPQLDGNEVARSLREEGNRTPILMLTARDSTQDIIRGLNLGADDYIILRSLSPSMSFSRASVPSRGGDRFPHPPFSGLATLTWIQQPTWCHELAEPFL
jgi:CheY-like chemotaxis protein